MRIRYEGVEYDASDRWSFGDFTGHDLRGANLNGQIIYGSCFSREIPDSQVFPANVTGLVLVNCNLDNVALPAGASAIGGTRKRFRVQNDLRDWEINGSNQPTRLMDEGFWQRRGISIDPRDIPAQRITLTSRESLEEKLRSI